MVLTVYTGLDCDCYGQHLPQICIGQAQAAQAIPLTPPVADLPLVVQPSLGPGNLQGALVVHLHTVHAQLALHINVGTNRVIGQLLERVALF